MLVINYIVLYGAKIGEIFESSKYFPLFLLPDDCASLRICHRMAARMIAFYTPHATTMTRFPRFVAKYPPLSQQVVVVNSREKRAARPAFFLPYPRDLWNNHVFISNLTFLFLQVSNINRIFVPK
jgi:hypothetical protein